MNKTTSQVPPEGQLSIVFVYNIMQDEITLKLAYREHPRFVQGAIAVSTWKSTKEPFDVSRCNVSRDGLIGLLRSFADEIEKDPIQKDPPK